uniref:Single domain-containing protein n=1 Tax=Timema shepardi TaxID=629360 RepID=A0A7R9B2L3_TIMSH|nr:unnamed protein product [Timema shepardi]
MRIKEAVVKGAKVVCRSVVVVNLTIHALWNEQEEEAVREKKETYRLMIPVKSETEHKRLWDVYNEKKINANKVLQVGNMKLVSTISGKRNFSCLNMTQTKIYLLFVLSAVIISVSKAQISRQILKEDKDHPGQCYDPSTKKAYATGSSWTEKGCTRGSCETGSENGTYELTYAGCGLISVEKGCKSVTDETKPYPDCCTREEEGGKVLKVMPEGISLWRGGPCDSAARDENR